MARSSWLIRWPLILATLHVARADFGDFADHTFQCPATTTCPLVCVANVTDCPPNLLCGVNETLCGDGTCVGVDEICESDESPCPFECASVACAKTVDLFTSCQSKYGYWYKNATDCGANEADDVPLLTFHEPGFVFCYCWISSITFVIFAWCFINQVIFPVKGSTKVLSDVEVTSNNSVSNSQAKEEENGSINISHTTANTADVAEVSQNLKPDDDDVKMSKEHVACRDKESFPEVEIFDGDSWTQTGYRRALFPFILYLLVLSTLVGVHVLLTILTILYYVQQEAVTILPNVFQSDRQALKAFEIAWGVGFAFSFALQWPYSVDSLFLRRCRLVRATHVAVFTPMIMNAADTTLSNKSTTIAKMKQALGMSYALFTRLMSLLFCDIRHTKVPGKTVFVPVKTDQDGTRFFFFRYRRYNYDPDQDKFIPGIFFVGCTLGDYLEASNGLSESEVIQRRGVVGPNSLHVTRPNLFRCIYQEFCKPFYTYQYFMVWTWFPYWYYYMGLVNTTVITFGGLTVAAFRYRQERILSKLSEIHGEVSVLRNEAFVRIPQSEIVPGDVVVIEPGPTFCDMVLVSSDGILVDESGITGESTLVSKKPVDPLNARTDYNRITHKKHTIYAGTIVIECDETSRDLAVVSTTGSSTARGKLLRDILSYERHQFKFDTEVRIVIFVLFLYSVFGFAMVSYFLKNAPIYAFFYGMYVVGTCLPPLLPTVFTVSVGISDSRLVKKRVAVANSEGILVAGKVNKVFFDKTGTLTKQGLDFASAKCTSTWASTADQAHSSISKDLSRGMAVCHNLTVSKTGDIVGNPVDQIMFQASGATIKSVDGSMVEVIDASSATIRVVKHFDFDHHLALQSVVISDESSRLIAYVKGSDESIKKRCLDGTLPADYDLVAAESAKSGVYQISMAMKIISDDGIGVDPANLLRDDIEKDLTFVGLINFKNALRDETPGVISELKSGDCQVTIVTGDHVLTGIRIAKEAGVIESSRTVLLCTKFESGKGTWIGEDGCTVELHSIEEVKAKYDLAITGDAWNDFLQCQPRNAQRLAPYIRVFGRCTPIQKVSVVSTFVNLGFITLMCGDGGNDCGALKTAHVGIALSDSEASVVSPFTSLDKTPTAVPEVLKEGRCALASSLSSYKFMILYGQLETINQIVNAYFAISFLEWNWVFMDGIWTIMLAFSLPLSKAATKLAPTRPTSSLLGIHTMSSACGIILLNFIFFAGALFYLFGQDWFQCRKWGSTDVSNTNAIGDNYESQVIFLVSGYQYISAAIAFNYGYEYRQGWARNYVFVALVAGFSAIHFFITVVPSRLSCFWRVNCDNNNVVRWVTKIHLIAIQNAFNTTLMPELFRWKLLIFIIFNAVTIQVYEYFIVNGIGTRFARDIKNRKLRDLVEDPLDEDVDETQHQ